MRKLASLVLAAVVPFCVGAQEKAKSRPKIQGIVQVRLYATNLQNAEDFYYGILRALARREPGQPCDWCERVPTGDRGPIEFEATKGPLPRNLLSAVAFRTDDAENLRKNLKRARVKVGKLSTSAPGTSFSAYDPENHKLVFVQVTDGEMTAFGVPGAYESNAPAWPHIIHAGFVVKDRGAMDKFYRGILGFKLYWSGGMKDGETDWVDMQVPDGTDWIEYMLHVPADAGKRTLGVMNHIGLGVVSVKSAAAELEKNGMELTEQPKIGRGGKWLLNLYDPDGTRVELMEFTPAEKPCCSEYTGNHPKP